MELSSLTAVPQEARVPSTHIFGPKTHNKMVTASKCLSVARDYRHNARHPESNSIAGGTSACEEVSQRVGWSGTHQAFFLCKNNTGHSVSCKLFRKVDTQLNAVTCIHPIYYPRITLALPPSRSSDPGSHSGPSPPYSTTIHAFIFVTIIV